jgi:hypothetical protein
MLVRAVTDLAAAQRGALIVLPGHDPIERHIEGGIKLEGRLSEPLLLSLFDPNSPGHDGAAVLHGDQVRLFAAHLPLSADHEQLRMRGTRHAAALGLAERSDALCVVVSEERGRISVAQEGRIRELLQTTELAETLREHFQEKAGPQRTGPKPLRLLRRNWRETAIAIAVSVILWALVIPGSEETERTIRIPVVVDNLPAGYSLEEVNPSEVEATVSGLRRDLFFLDSRRLQASVDAFLVKVGRRTFELSPQSVRGPARIAVTAVDPKRIILTVKASQVEGPNAGTSAAVPGKSR